MGRDRLALFKGRHFEPEIIILCVRRYLQFALSLRNLEEIMTERNVHVGIVTLRRSTTCVTMRLQEVVCSATRPGLREGSRPGDFVSNSKLSTTELSIIGGGEQVASRAEMRGNDAVHLDKALSMALSH
jgi:hypothetical protein